MLWLLSLLSLLFLLFLFWGDFVVMLSCRPTATGVTTACLLPPPKAQFSSGQGPTRISLSLPPRTYPFVGWRNTKPDLKKKYAGTPLCPLSQSSAGQAATTTTTTTSNKRKSSGGGGSSSSQDDARRTGGGSGGGAPLVPMAPATQLEWQGLGRRVGLASILLSEPFVAKLMYRHASDKVPEACGERGMLPREHPVFAPLLQLLDQGTCARQMLRAGEFGVRSVEDELTRIVLPCVVALHARAEGAVAAARRRGNNGDDSNAGKFFLSACGVCCRDVFVFVEFCF